MAALDELIDSTRIISKIEQRARALLPSLLAEKDKAKQRLQDAEQERFEVEVEVSEQKRLLEELGVSTQDVTLILVECERRIEFYQELLLGYQGKVRALERKSTKTEEMAFIWMRELRRRSVIAYCTAFENFLRDFLVERIVLKPAKFEHYLVNRRQKPVKLRTPLSKTEVDDYVADECRVFQNISEKGKIQKLYDLTFGKKPFGAFITPNKWFAHESERMDAYADIQILFSLRHEFVHRKGLAGRQYQQQMLGDSRSPGIPFQSRLDPALSPDPHSVPPNPDDILDSKPISTDYRNKLDEMASSLLRYAKYIQEVCAT